MANRDVWTVTALGEDGALEFTGRTGLRPMSASYADTYVELAFTTTAHGAEGETLDSAHVSFDDTGVGRSDPGLPPRCPQPARPERTPELAPDAQHIVCLVVSRVVCRAGGGSFARGRSTPAATASPYPTTSSPRWPGEGR